MEFTVTSPIDGSVYATHRYHEWGEVEDMVEAGGKAFREWSERSAEERIAVLSKWVDTFSEQREELSRDLTFQMGRPCSEAPLEIDEFVARSRRVLELAPEVLADYDKRERGSLRHFISPEPLGLVLVQAGWNYPYIISAHSVLPALVSGNCVLLRHSSQTPSCSIHLEKSFLEAGGPPAVLQALRLNRANTERLHRHKGIAQVAVTGALPNTEPEPRSRRRRHIGLGLDLGGKDAAYIRPDADIARAAKELSRAAFGNAGQSCLGVEKIYVHKTCFSEFLEALKAEAEELKLGDPTEDETTLGPMVRFQAAVAVYDQVNSTIKQGAVPLLPNKPPERAYFYPQILTHVDHTMKIMAEETFGPAVGVMEVGSDEQAVSLMNDSRYALGSSIWTAEPEFGLQLMKKVNTATSSVNHCDYLDPAIAFLGINGSPRGFTLSHFGFRMLTNNRSYWVGPHS